MVLIHGFGGGANGATVRVGSDFDGVSDALEANLIYNNYLFTNIYVNLGPTDTHPVSLFDGTSSHFGGLNAGVRMSFRGNVTVGNAPVPFNFFAGDNSLMSAWTNYEAAYMETNSGRR